MMKDLSVSVAEWLTRRLEDRRLRWAYNPRSSELNSFIRTQFVADLLESQLFERSARSGDVCCEFSTTLGADGRRAKKLDAVLGRPVPGTLSAIDGPDPLRLARVECPLLALEVKLCMTAHGKAKTRLIQELTGSLAAVSKSSSGAVPVAIVLVNGADRFFSPLNRPGPNEHPVGAATSVLEEIRAEFPTDGGGYGAIAFGVIDFDNDTRAKAIEPHPSVTKDRTYAGLLSYAAAVVDDALKRSRGRG